MGITATLGWQSEIAEGAQRDASAVRALQAALAAVSSASAASGLQATGAAAAVAAVQVQALKNAAQGEALVAQSMAQRNAALAKLIQSQASAEQRRAAIAAQGAARVALEDERGAQQRLNIEAKSAADLEKVEAQHAARMAELAAREQAAAVRRASGAGAGKGPDYTGALGALLGGRSNRLGSALSKLGVDSGVASLIGGAATSALRVAEEVGRIVERLAAKIVDLSIKGSELAISATSAREQLVAAFEGMGKSEASSEALYKKAIDLSIKTGRDTNIIAAEFKRLVSSGFKNNQLSNIAKMLEDVSDVKGEGKANQLEKLLEKMNAKGSLDTRVITALTNQGFSQADIYAKLAKALNKPVADIPALIKSGKIDSKTAIDAVTSVVEKQVGGVADKLANTVPALIARLKTAATTLFDSVDLGPIKDFLNNILSVITGPTGQELKDSVSELFSSIFETIFGPFKGDGKDRVQETVKRIASGFRELAAEVRKARPVVEAIVAKLEEMGKKGELEHAARAIGLGLSIAGDAALYFLEQLDELNDTIDAFGSIADAVQDAISGVSDAITGFFSGMYDWVANFFQQGQDIGNALIDGMTDGLTSSLSRAVDAAGAVADAVVAHVKSILGIHSPSTVFGEIGYYSVAGFAGAVDTHAHMASAAAARMAYGAANAANDNHLAGGFGPSAFAGAGRAPSGGAGERGPMSVVFHPGSIVIGAGASAQAGGDKALAQLVREEIVAYFRRESEAA